MKVECAYCKRTIKAAGDESLVSHGICSDCLPDILSHNDISIEDYMESIPYPAVLVNDNGEPVAENALYRSRIGSDTETAKNLMEGRTTVEDKGSPTGQSFKGTDTVRMMVRETLNSGEDLTVTTATAKITRRGKTGRMNMLIGTQKIGKNVIVGIEDIVSMQWYSSMSTGLQELDRQHFEMDQILHKLTTASFDEGIQLLKELARKMKEHFTYEEGLLENGRLLVGSQHRAEHKKVLKWVVSIVRDATNNGAADFANISAQLAEHLTAHVANFDQFQGHEDHQP